nr:G protein-coupled receptor [Proales similis]
MLLRLYYLTCFLYTLSSVSSKCIFWEALSTSECLVSSFSQWIDQLNINYTTDVYSYEVVSESKQLVLTNQDLRLISTRDSKPDFKLLGFSGLSLDLFSRPLEYQTRYNIKINFIFSSFQILTQKEAQKWEIYENCDLDDFEGVSLRPEREFKVDLSYQRYNIYHENICPIIFLNLTINMLKFNDITQSMVKRNMLSFKNLTTSKKEVNLRLHLNYLVFHNIYMARLSTNLFHQQVFKSFMNSIEIRGHFRQADRGFLQFVAAEKLYFRVHNLREFVHLNPDWLNGYSTNKTSHIYIIQKKFEQNKLETGLPAAFDIIPAYSYPDEDFCIFRNYPIEIENIFILLENDFPLNLTCTALWLMNQVKDLSKFQSEIITLLKWTSVSTRFYDLLRNPEELLQTKNNCNFSDRLAMCDKLQPRNRDIKYELNVYDVLIPIQMIKFVISVALKPFISVFGMILGFYTYLAFRDLKIRAKKSHEQQLVRKKANLFEYMQFNALFGAIYNLSLLPRLLGDCVDFGGIYCSPLFAKNAVRLFMLIDAQYFAASIRMCANLSFLAFTAYRFSMNQVSKGLEAFSSFCLKQKPKRVMAVSVLLAFILNVCCLFYNDQDTVHTLSFLPRYDIFKYDLREEFVNQDIFPMSIYIFLLLINDFLLPFACFLFDFRLLLFLKAHLRKSSSLNTSKNKKESSEKKLTNFIIFSGIANFILMTPHTLVSIFRMVDQLYHNDHRWDESLCIFSGAIFFSPCLNIFSATENLLGFRTSVEFFLFILFNREFTESFKKRLSLN